MFNLETTFDDVREFAQLSSVAEPVAINPEYGDAKIDSISEIFHEATKYHRATFLPRAMQIENYLKNPSMIARSIAGQKKYPYLRKFELPPPETPNASLASCLAHRESCTAFEGSIPVQHLSTLMSQALGINRIKKNNITGGELTFRPYPSAGNLNAVEVYAFLNNVDSVQPCTAHYDQRNNLFRIIEQHDGKAFSGVEITSEGKGISSSIVIVLTVVAQRLSNKYGDRGYRFALLEAGHAAQNLCLAATALNLGSLVYAAYYDDELASILNIDGVIESVATVVCIGPKKKEASL